MYIYTFLLRMTDTVTSQNIDLSSWNTLYIRLMYSYVYSLNTEHIWLPLKSIKFHMFVAWLHY
jgi:hypothetical protein